MGMNDVNSLSHTKWNCKYHIVFAPKYRRKVFFKEKRVAIGKILRQLCEWKGVKIIEAEACPDHIHLFVEIPPKMSVSSFMGYLKGKSTHGCSRMFDHPNGAECVWPLDFNEEVFMREYREQGYVVQADTIEELAQKLGLLVENFKKTVERYNELYDKQNDEDFGKEPHRLSALRTAPFEGIRLSGGYFICTLDGIKIDTNMNALDKEGNPIEGLYVAGDCSGSYFDASYPNLLAGCAAGRSGTFGRLAGRNAAHREV